MESSKKVLFLALHRPDRSPSQRFRFEQYLGFLSTNGYSCEFSYLISENDDKIFYGSGNYLGKFGILWRSFWKRWKESKNADQYDLIFVQRECFMLGTTFFEKRFASKSKMIFDFDDSIWLQFVSEGNKSLSFLKDASKTSKLIEISDMIFAGNQYLADYAAQFNKNIKIIPTTIDTDEYQRLTLPKQAGRVCIGWSGSFTTIEHFKHAVPSLKKLKEKYGDKIYFKVIGSDKYVNDDLGIKGLNWNKKDELKELSEIDIGLMPLPNDEWTKGKCGLKGLQYMALEIATIMSNVGVNGEIIEDGVNGYLINKEEDWVEKISMLIENDALRKSMGAAGRKTVLDFYSVESQKERYLDYLQEVVVN